MSGLTIPEKGTTPFPFQSRWFGADVEIMKAAIGGRTGVIAEGCEVTESAIPAMSVLVAAGQNVINLGLQDVIEQTVSIVDADALLPRFDTIVGFDDGTFGALEGIPDAAPRPPIPTSDVVGIGQVWVPEGSTSITNDNIVDKRMFVPSPLEASPWIMKSALTDLIRSNNAALSADPILQVPVSANGVYRVRWFVPWVLSINPEPSSTGVQWRWELPGGTTSPVFCEGEFDNVGVATGGAFYGRIQSNIWGSAGAQWGAISNTFAGDPIHTAHTKGEMVLKVGPSTTGLLVFQWSQQTATAQSTTRKAGAYVEYQVV